LLAGYANADPARFVSLSGRFSNPTLPGDVLEVITWHTEEGRVEFVAQRDGGEVVLANGVFEIRT
jgi:hypothetical protein